MYNNYMQKKPCSCGPNYPIQSYEPVVQPQIADMAPVFDEMYPYIQEPMYNYYNDCDCGFEEPDRLFPENPMYAQSYVPWQTMSKTFIPRVGLQKGTLFPELVEPYSPDDSQALSAYIAETNKIGKGCNA